MSSALRATQSLWCTLATERTPGNIEMYKLFRRLGSTISSADLHVEDLRVIRRELWKFRKFMESHYNPKPRDICTVLRCKMLLLQALHQCRH